MRVVALIVGVALTVWTLYGLVQAMLIPRDSVNIIGRTVTWVVTQVSHAPLHLMTSYRSHDRWLAGAAPLTIFLQLMSYVVILIFTVALTFYGLSGLTYADSLYQSGSTFTTLGIVQAPNAPTIVVAFLSAFLGLVVVAIFIGYLMAIYGAYVTRESQMARVSMVAGEPAWGVQILVRAHLLGIPEEQAPLAMSWIDWITSVRLSQRVNPILGAFRSTSPQRHWATTALAVLDAAALRLALRPAQRDARHIELITVGATSFRVLAEDPKDRDLALNNWKLEAQLLRALDGEFDGTAGCGVTRAEFEDALDELAAVGFPLPDDRDSAWVRFAGVRDLYAPALYSLALRFHAVPGPWSGSRSPALEVEWPVRAGFERHV